MYNKSRSFEGLSEKTAAGDEDCLFRRFHPFFALETIRKNVRPCIVVILCWQMKKKEILSIVDEVSILYVSFEGNISSREK
jgi:hypothetical protein